MACHSFSKIVDLIRYITNRDEKKASHKAMISIAMSNFT